MQEQTAIIRRSADLDVLAARVLAALARMARGSWRAQADFDAAIAAVGVSVPWSKRHHVLNALLAWGEIRNVIVLWDGGILVTVVGEAKVSA